MNRPFNKGEGAPTVQPDDDSLYFCIRGKKRYEFSNHLGNVMTTLTDRWVADAVSGQDYDPFGMVRPNRSVSEDGYRFGFNGKEKDTEFGEVVYDYGFRIYDGRICRFLSVDPLSSTYPSNSPYIFAENTPIMAIDLDGLELFIASTYTDKSNTKVGMTDEVKIQVQAIIENFNKNNPGVNDYLIKNGIKIPISISLFEGDFIKKSVTVQKYAGGGQMKEVKLNYEIPKAGHASGETHSNLYTIKSAAEAYDLYKKTTGDTEMLNLKTEEDFKKVADNYMGKTYIEPIDIVINVGIINRANKAINDAANTIQDETQKLLFYQNNPKESIQTTTLHEVGHFIWNKANSMTYSDSKSEKAAQAFEKGSYQTKESVDQFIDSSKSN